MKVIVALCSLAVSVASLAATPADKGVDLRIECDWGSGHFEYSPEMASFLGRYIRDAVRADGDGTPSLPGSAIAVSGDNDSFGGALPLPPRAKRPAFVTLCAYERNSDGGTIYEFRRLEHS